MKIHADDSPGASIQGQVLRLSARREVALYLRQGTLWVADFIDGRGALIDPSTWIRFNCATPSAIATRRRMLRESAVPVSAELAHCIESLHRSLRKDAQFDGPRAQSHDTRRVE